MKQLKLFLFVLLAIIFITAFLALPETINLLVNPGFENKDLNNWTAFESCRLVLFNLAKHSGKRSLAFYPLKEGAGIRSDMSTVIQPGYRYLFTGWFRNVEAGWGQIDVLLIYQQAGQTRHIPISRADCNKDIWTELSNQFFVPEQVDTSGLQLVIKTAWGQNAFLVDDLELRPTLQIHFDRPSPPNEPAIVFQIGPRNEKRNKLQIHADIFDYRKKIMKQIDQPLDTPIQASLPTGFYRILASTQDKV